MKNNIKYGFFALAACLAFASCEDDRDANPTVQQPAEGTFVLNDPAGVSQLIDLENSKCINLAFSQPDYGFPAAAKYKVEVSLKDSFTILYDNEADDNSAADYFVLDEVFSTCNIEVRSEGIADAMQRLAGYKEDAVPEKEDLYMRVVASLAGTQDIASNSVRLSVVPMFVQLGGGTPDIWFMVGGGIGDGSWGNDGLKNIGKSLIPLEGKIGGIFDKNGLGQLTFTGHFVAGTEFKIIHTPGKWDEQWGMKDGKFVAKTPDLEPDNIKVEETGYYTVTLDTKKSSCSMEKYDGTPKVYTEMLISGGFNEWGTSTQMLPVQTIEGAENHVWAFDIEGLDGDGAKFLQSRWAPNWGASDFPFGYGENNGANIKAPEAGKNYRAVFNDITGFYYFVELAD